MDIEAIIMGERAPKTDELREFEAQLADERDLRLFALGVIRALDVVHDAFFKHSAYWFAHKVKGYGFLGRDDAWYGALERIADKQAQQENG